MLDFRDLESMNMLNFQPNQIKAEISNDIVNKSQTPANIKRCVSVCKGCGQEIYDQYILRVAPDLEWHAACLKCVDCQEYLDERCTCYVKETKVYCKADYLRLFSPKCFKCQQAIKPMDYVTRVRNERTYHVNCFHCVVCLRLLLPGEEFVLRGDNILCKSDSEELDKTEALSRIGFVDFSDDPIVGSQGLFGAAVGRGQLTPLRNNNSETPPLNSLSQSPCNNSNNNRSNSPPIGIAEHPSISGSNSSPGSDQTATNSSICHQQQQHSNNNSNNMNNNNNSGGGYGGRLGAHHILSSPPPPSHHHHHKKEKKDKPKTTRVRTVLNEKQLHTLRSIYGANPRPDALMKEQLVEMTGLSPRVIRVWFQNKRCKDKKRQIALKQMQQQQEKNQALNSIRLHGVGPLITGAPGRLDMPPMMQALDVHQFQQNSAIWKQGGAPPPPPGLQGLVTDFGSPNGMLRGGPPPPEAMMIGLDGQTPFQQLLHGFGDPSMDPGNMGYLPSSIAYANSMNSDLRSISPQLVASDLSSPSCSE